MESALFSISEALRYGYKTLKRNLGLSLAIGVVGLGAVLLVNGFGQASHRTPGLAVGFRIAGELVQVLFGLVWIRYALSVHDGRPLGARELFPSAKSFVDYLAVSILYGLLVLAGLVLLVVPGIYFAVRYGFVGYVVADGRADPLGAFRRSSELTRGARFRLLWFAIVLVLLNLVGAALAGVGLLFTIPTSTFAVAFVYRRLAARTEPARFAPAPFEPAPV
jgi:uncharacterized membrane protein